MTVVRLAIDELSEEIKRKHRLPGTLVDVRIEADSIVLYFSRNAEATAPVTRTALRPRSQNPAPSVSVLDTQTVGRRRTAKGRRNRMKTRGWPVVGRFANSRGQNALIYRPFVDALAGKRMAPSEQKAAIAQILRANGNRPSMGSIEYFWLNTIEYLREASKNQVVAHAD
jgi:hypothetical protein